MSEDYKLSYISGSSMSGEETNKPGFSYEEAVSQFGTGRYQVLICLFFALGSWGLLSSNEGYIWMGGHMDHTCVVPGSEHSMNITEIFNEQTDLLVYIPSDDQCTYSEVLVGSNGTNTTQRSGLPCTKWIYDQSNFLSTIMSEWDLNACNGKWKISLGASLNILGYLIGCYLFGYLSDRFGRLRVFIISYAVLVILGVAAAYSVNITMLITMRFLFGLVAPGTKNTGVVYATEILTPKWRTYNAPIMASGYWVLTIVSIAVAQQIRSWRTYQLITACSAIIFIPFWWLLHESPLWLLSRGRKEEAMKYFKTSAWVNKQKLPSNMELTTSKTDGEPETVRYLDLMKSRNIRTITILLGLLWMLSSAITVGFSFNVGNMAGDIYQNMYITTAGGPIQFILILVLYKGRRLLLFLNYFPTCLLFVVISILMFYTQFEDVMLWAVPIASGFGRVLIGSSFTGLYITTPEFYPTYMRVTALGVCSSFARIGGAIAPYITLLRGELAALPYLIFASLTLIAGVLVIPLPETANRQLPQSLKELEENFEVKCQPTCCQKKGGIDLGSKMEPYN